MRVSSLCQDFSEDGKGKERTMDGPHPVAKNIFWLSLSASNPCKNGNSTPSGGCASVCLRWRSENVSSGSSRTGSGSVGWDPPSCVLMGSSECVKPGGWTRPYIVLALVVVVAIAVVAMQGVWVGWREASFRLHSTSGHAPIKNIHVLENISLDPLLSPPPTTPPFSAAPSSHTQPHT